MYTINTSDILDVDDENEGDSIRMRMIMMRVEVLI
jgi:hypothetical protein